MIAIFIILYCAIIWFIFHQLKIKPRPSNIAASALTGVLAIGTIVILWKFSSPISDNLVSGRYSVQLVPQVNGPVSIIHAEPNTPLKKGVDKLFEVERDSYQFKYDQAVSGLNAAEKGIEQAAAGVASAQAAITKSKASLAATDAELTVAKETAKLSPGAISKIKVKQLLEQVNAAEAGVQQAEAGHRQSEFALLAAKDNALSLKAKLAAAAFDLEQCVIYAPADGYVTAWTVREGTMAVSVPFAPVGTFIDTSRVVLVASFSQSVLSNVQPGDPVEITFKTRPGEFFTGTVETIVQATGEGQFSPSGKLMSAADIGSKGKLAVRFTLDDEEVANSLPMGTSGSVAIYTEFGKPFQIISKVGMRIKTWMYYIGAI